MHTARLDYLTEQCSSQVKWVQSFNKADFPWFKLCLLCNCIMDVRKYEKIYILEPLREPLGTGIVKRESLRTRNR